MLRVFNIFCNGLMQFITHAVFKCTPANTHGFACKLRRLDVSGLGCFYLGHKIEHGNIILEGICNSTIDTFGHKFEIVADVNLCLRPEPNKEFELLRNIIEESSKPDVGITVYFKTISISKRHNTPLPSNFYNILALGKCKYIQLDTWIMQVISLENLQFNLPELLGISFLADTTTNIQSLDFLRTFEYLEHVSIELNIFNDLIDSISNMSKGLIYLSLYNCFLDGHDLECLANSKHSDTLLELNLADNVFENDSEALGLIMLCQKLRNIIVLKCHRCSLDILTSNSITKLIYAIKDCEYLEVLSLWENPFSLEITNIIIDVLADSESLRYLNLYLSGVTDGDGNFISRNEEYLKEYMNNLCKPFHEKINKFGRSAIYISWSTYY